MKKTSLILALCFSVFADDNDIARKIYLSIAQEVTHKEKTIFYVHGSVDALDALSVKKINDCDSADIVILSTWKKLPKSCLNKPLFTTRYRIFTNKKKVFGAFFWQKGRPNIIFSQKRLNEQNISLSSEFDRFIEQ
ncbi:MAG: hypothetical protein U9N52_08780 [Campylobacterota bacterium]|nr:hypothetical protein [Campylobacterota bacterium]